MSSQMYPPSPIHLLRWATTDSVLSSEYIQRGDRLNYWVIVSLKPNEVSGLGKTPSPRLSCSELM